MPFPVNTEALKTKDGTRLLRIAVLSASIFVALATTSLLSLVWEASVDGRSFRPLFPAHLVNRVFSVGTATGLIVGLLEFRGRLSFSATAYPLLTILYFGYWWTVTLLSTHDFVISRSHPPTTANKTDAGNGSEAICRVSNVLRSPSPDPKRSPNQQPHPRIR